MEKGIGIAALAQDPRRFLGLAEDLFRSRLGTDPRDGTVDGGAEGVEVGPGSLPAALIMLLDRGIAGGEGGEHRGLGAQGDIARRAEIDEDGGTVWPDQDIGGLDVAMQDIGGMDPLQTIQQ